MTISKRHVLLFTAALSISVVLNFVNAQEVEQPANPNQSAAMQYSFSISAGALEQALVKFSALTGVTVSFTPETVNTLSTQGLNGQYSADQGLRELLQGTGISAEFKGSSATLVTVADNDSVMVLDAVTIESSVITESAYGPVEGYIATRSTTGTKTDAALKEVPRSISVVSSEQMEAQGAATFNEALRYTAGVFSESRGVNSRSAVISARGFTGVETYLDGMSMDSGGNQSKTGGAFPLPNAYGLERVSVMRGPSSTLYGNGSLGGVVDLTSKRPTVEPLREIELLTGSYERKEGRFDISDTITGNTNLRYRLTGVWRDSGSQIDHVDDDKQYLAPVINWQASDNTDLTLMAYYQKDSGGNLGLNVPLEGSLVPNPFGKINNGAFFGEPDSDNYESKTSSVAWDIEHRFNEQWSVKHQARYTESDYEEFFVGGYASISMSSFFITPMLFPDSPLGQPLPDTIAILPPLFGGEAQFNVPNPWAGYIPLRTILRSYTGFVESRNTITTDTHIMGEVMTGAAIKHDLLFGLDYSQKKNEHTRYVLANSSPNDIGLLGALAAFLPLDVFEPVYGQVPLDQEISRVTPQEVKQAGLYFQDRITINEKLIVTFGARHDDYSSYLYSKSGYPNAGFASDLDESDTTYQGGVNYLFDSGFTPYLSYSESYVPQSGNNYLFEPFEPTTGSQYEAGIKYELLDNTVLVTLAYFDLTRNNLPMADEEHFGCTVGNPLSTCRKAAGEVASSGIELEIKAAPLPELNIMASYGTNDVHVAKDDDPDLIGKSLIQQPKKQASLWAMYRFYNGALEGFGISAGTRYIGSTYEDTANTVEVSAYSVFDLGLYYNTRHGFDFAINASNVTDKQYLASCSYGQCNQGLERKITGTASYRW